VKSEKEKRRAFLLGYVKGRKEMRRELAQIRDELAEWRSAVEARRAAETAIVDFWRDAHYQRETGSPLQ
jgi:hypothetical protein